MGDVLKSLVLVLVFSIIGGLFAAAEIALVSLREAQVSRLAVTGKAGRRLAALTANPNRFLAAGQVGVTLAGFLSAAFGGAEIAPRLSPVLQGWGIPASVANPVSFVVVTVVIAYFALVLGELAPKRLALQRVESVALAAAGPINFMAIIFHPFIALLSVSSDAVVRLFGGDPAVGKEQITGADLRDMVASHADLSVEERELIDDVFAAGDRELREVMVPRTEVDFLDASLPTSQAVRIIVDAPHSRYPVIRGSADDIAGFVHVRDILDPAVAERSIRVSELVRPITAFPGTKGILSTLTEMRRLRLHLAVVEDEYGGTAGIVTMEDLVEELIGDIRDEYDPVTASTSSRLSGISDIDGLLNLEDFSESTGIQLPEGPYETVAGYVIAQLGALPQIGDSVDVDGHRLAVSRLDGRRIAMLRLTPLPVTATDPSP